MQRIQRSDEFHSEQIAAPGRRQAMLPHNVLMAAILSMSACTTSQGNIRSTSFQSIVPVERAFVLPSLSGLAVSGVIERSYRNAIKQDIFLKAKNTTPGQNMISAMFFGVTNMRTGTYLQNTKTSKTGYSAEMKQALPNVAMTISPFFVRNDYGPFGYATGAGAGKDRCIYAWQKIVGSGISAASIQLRLRLCKANANDHELLSVMYGLTINFDAGTLAWDPYGAVSKTPPQLAAVGNPIASTASVSQQKSTRPKVIQSKTVNVTVSEQKTEPIQQASGVSHHGFLHHKPMPP